MPLRSAPPVLPVVEDDMRAHGFELERNVQQALEGVRHPGLVPRPREHAQDPATARSEQLAAKTARRAGRGVDLVDERRGDAVAQRALELPVFVEQRTEVAEIPAAGEYPDRLVDHLPHHPQLAVLVRRGGDLLGGNERCGPRMPSEHEHEVSLEQPQALRAHHDRRHAEVALAPEVDPIEAARRRHNLVLTADVLLEPDRIVGSPAEEGHAKRRATDDHQKGPLKSTGGSAPSSSGIHVPGFTSWTSAYASDAMVRAFG